VNVRLFGAGLVAAACTAGSVVAWRGEPTRADPVETATGGVAVDGAALFHAKGCASCHRSAITEPFVDGFPDLTDISAWGGTRRPGLDAAAYIRQSVREPTAFLSPVWRGAGGPTTGMPSLAVSDAELDAIVSFLLR
jgi:mono/diheme cytochrome c family protein